MHTNRGTNETAITHLLINWRSAALEFYSHCTNKIPESTGLLTFPFVRQSETKFEEKRHSEISGMENEVGHVRFKQGSTKNLGYSVDSIGGQVLQDRTNLSFNTTNETLSSAEQRVHIEESTTTGKLQGSCTHFDQLSTSDSASPFETSWSTISYNSNHHHGNMTSSLHVLNGRGTYVCKLSPTCNVAALAVNQMEPADTRVLFFSPVVKAGIASHCYQTKVEGNSGRWGSDIVEFVLYHFKQYLCSICTYCFSFLKITSYTIIDLYRTFWIADMAWTSDGLFLVCVTKRGSLAILPRFGPPIKLIARGCSIEIGPKLFLPIHPLITVM